MSEARPKNSRHKSPISIWLSEARKVGVDIDTSSPQFYPLASRMIKLLKDKFLLSDSDLRCLFAWSWRVLAPWLKEQGYPLSHPRQLFAHMDNYRTWVEARKTALQTHTVEELVAQLEEADPTELARMRKMLSWKR